MAGRVESADDKSPLSIHRIREIRIRNIQIIQSAMFVGDKRKTAAEVATHEYLPEQDIHKYIFILL